MLRKVDLEAYETAPTYLCLPGAGFAGCVENGTDTADGPTAAKNAFVIDVATGVDSSTWIPFLNISTGCYGASACHEG